MPTAGALESTTSVCLRLTAQVPVEGTSPKPFTAIVGMTVEERERVCGSAGRGIAEKGDGWECGTEGGLVEGGREESRFCIGKMLRTVQASEGSFVAVEGKWLP